MRTLYVAAGGGGDAVGALLARRALGDVDERPPLVSTCAWERLRIDPVPGPRARADFRGLGLVGGKPSEVLAPSDTVPSGRSVLPRLAETSGARIFLHDFEGGAEGLTGQLQRLATSLDVDKLVVVDVGGDIVARGPEPDLLSPLADSLTLAAAVGTGIATSVVVIGPGDDAELSEVLVLDLLERLDAVSIGNVSAEDVRALHETLSWHPTEATAIASAGAQGVRGMVMTRRGGAPVPLTDHASEVWLMSRPQLSSFPLAEALRASTALGDAEDVMRTLCFSEIDFERAVSEQGARTSPRLTLHEVISDMAGVGATHITKRRLRESLSQPSWTALNRPDLPAGGLWEISELEQLARKVLGEGTRE